MVASELNTILDIIITVVAVLYLAIGIVCLVRKQKIDSIPYFIGCGLCAFYWIAKII